MLFKHKLFSLACTLTMLHTTTAETTYWARGFRSIYVNTGSVSNCVTINQGDVFELGYSNQELVAIYTQKVCGSSSIDTYCLQLSRSVPFGKMRLTGRKFPVWEYDSQSAVWSNDRKSGARQQQRDDFRTDLEQRALQQGMEQLSALLGILFLPAMILFIIILIYAIAFMSIAAQASAAVSASSATRESTANLFTAIQENPIQAVSTTIDTAVMAPAMEIADTFAQYDNIGLLCIFIMSVFLLGADCAGGLKTRLMYSVVVTTYLSALGLVTFFHSDSKVYLFFFSVAFAVPAITLLGSLRDRIVNLIEKIPRWIYWLLWIGSAVPISHAVQINDLQMAYKIFGTTSFISTLPKTIKSQVSAISNVLRFVFFSVVPALGFLISLSPYLSMYGPQDGVYAKFGITTNYCDLFVQNPANLLNINELKRFNANYHWPLAILTACVIIRFLIYFLFRVSTNEGAVKDFEEKVTKLYQKYNPSKISQIPQLMEKYAGREEELIRRIINKYGRHEENESTDNYITTAVADDISSDVAEEEEEQEEQKEEYNVLQYVENRILQIYKVHNPERIVDIPLLMRDNKGREIELLKRIIAKYDKIKKIRRR